MMRFKPLTTRNAPTKVGRALLKSVIETQGYLPRVDAILAANDGVLTVHIEMGKQQMRSRLAVTEMQIAMLEISRSLGSEYMHSDRESIAQALGISPALIEKIRMKSEIQNQRLQALRCFAAEVALAGGKISEPTWQAFLKAGFKPEHALDVICAVAHQTLSLLTVNLSGLASLARGDDR